MITYRIEGLFGVDTKHDENALTVPIVIFSDCFVFVLASSVPQLQLDFSSFDINDFVDIVDTDSHHVVLDELALAVTKQEVAFPHPRVADYYYFLEVVELLFSLALTLHKMYYALRIV